jgi:hypothetical protein
VTRRPDPGFGTGAQPHHPLSTEQSTYPPNSLSICILLYDCRTNKLCVKACQSELNETHALLHVPADRKLGFPSYRPIKIHAIVPSRLILYDSRLLFRLLDACIHYGSSMQKVHCAKFSDLHGQKTPTTNEIVFKVQYNQANGNTISKFNLGSSNALPRKPHAIRKQLFKGLSAPAKARFGRICSRK